MKSIIGYGLLFGLGAVLCGCADQAPEDTQELVTETSAALYKSGTRWPGSEVTGTWIPVCYQVGMLNNDGTTANQVPTRADAEAFAGRLRHYIENSWGRAANINFTGWGECTGGYDDWHPGTILVRLKQNIPFSGSLVGYQGSIHTGMTLDINDSRQPVVAIHEFGHALGFAHEFSRGDWACTTGAQACQSCTTNTDCSNSQAGSTCLSGFCHDPDFEELVNTVSADRESVMAATYVSNRVDGNVNGYTSLVDSLSAFDVLGAQRVYGRKPAGSVVGLGGRCLNINSGNTNWGNDMIAYPCTNSENDTWFYDPGVKTLRSQLTNGGTIPSSANICMNIWGGTVNPNAATPLKSYGCNNDANEKFDFNNVQIRTMGNMCLVAESATAGSYISLERCGTSTARERWNVVNRPVTSIDFVTNFTGFQLTGTNLCLQALNTDMGSPITLATCSTYATTQAFNTSEGVIRRHDAGSRCFNVLGGSDATGQRLGMWDGCYPSTPNAFFYLNGAVTSMDQCMDMYYAVSYDGAPIVMHPCNNGQNQDWDYYWR